MPDYRETFRGVVCPWHCDHQDHMNVMHYVGILRLIAPVTVFDPGTETIIVDVGGTLILISADPTAPPESTATIAGAARNYLVPLATEAITLKAGHRPI